MSQPMAQGVIPQHNLVVVVELLEEFLGVGKPVCPRGDRLLRIQVFYHPGGIAGRNGICGHVIYYHSTGTDNAVGPDCDPFAYNRTVTDPDVIFDNDRCRLPDGNPIVNIMPIGIGYIRIAGKHTVVTDIDPIG